MRSSGLFAISLNFEKDKPKNNLPTITAAGCTAFSAPEIVTLPLKYLENIWSCLITLVVKVNVFPGSSDASVSGLISK